MNKTISQGQTLRNKWKDTRTDFFWWRFAHMFNNLLMSFIFKLFKEVKFLTSYNYWEFGIITSTEPTLQRLKNAIFLLSILKTPLFWKFFRQPQDQISPPPLTKVLVAPLIMNTIDIKRNILSFLCTFLFFT